MFFCDFHPKLPPSYAMSVEQEKVISDHLNCRHDYFKLLKKMLMA